MDVQLGKPSWRHFATACGIVLALFLTALFMSGLALVVEWQEMGAKESLFPLSRLARAMIAGGVAGIPGMFCFLSQGGAFRRAAIISVSNGQVTVRTLFPPFRREFDLHASQLFLNRYVVITRYQTVPVNELRIAGPRAGLFSLYPALAEDIAAHADKLGLQYESENGQPDFFEALWQAAFLLMLPMAAAGWFFGS